MGFKEWIFRVDKLTSSIEEVATGKSFDTEVFELKKADLQLITKENKWHFNWSKELSTPGIQVYKLVIKNDSIIQGLIAIENRKKHLFLPLIETAPHNLGKA